MLKNATECWFLLSLNLKLQPGLAPIHEVSPNQTQATPLTKQFNAFLRTALLGHCYSKICKNRGKDIYGITCDLWPNFLRGNLIWTWHPSATGILFFLKNLKYNWIPFCFLFRLSTQPSFVLHAIWDSSTGGCRSSVDGLKSSSKGEIEVTLDTNSLF